MTHGPLDFRDPPGRNRKRHPFQARVEFQGIPIRIENLSGSERSGEDADGKPWRIRMRWHYGDFPGSLAADGDAVDVYVGPDHDAPKAYVIHQKHPTGPKRGAYDEDKVMLGFGDRRAARVAYGLHYDRPGFYAGMSVWPVADLAAALKDPKWRGKALRRSRPQPLKKGIFVLLQKSQIGLFGGSIGSRKVAIKAHSRTTKKGTVVAVKPHQAKRKKAAAPISGPRHPDSPFNETSPYERDRPKPPEDPESYEALAAQLYDPIAGQAAHIGSWRALEAVDAALMDLPMGGDGKRPNRKLLLSRLDEIEADFGEAMTGEAGRLGMGEPTFAGGADHVMVGGVRYLSVADTIKQTATRIVQANIKQRRRQLTEKREAWKARFVWPARELAKMDGRGLLRGKGYDHPTFIDGGYEFLRPRGTSDWYFDSEEQAATFQRGLAMSLADADALPKAHQDLFAAYGVEVQVAVTAAGLHKGSGMAAHATTDDLTGRNVVRLFTSSLMHPTAPTLRRGPVPEKGTTLVHELGHVVDDILYRWAWDRSDLKREKPSHAFKGTVAPEEIADTKHRESGEAHRDDGDGFYDGAVSWAAAPVEWFAEAYRYVYRDGGEMKTTLKGYQFGHRAFRRDIDRRVVEATADVKPISRIIPGWEEHKRKVEEAGWDRHAREAGEKARRTLGGDWKVIDARSASGIGQALRKAMDQLGLFAPRPPAQGGLFGKEVQVRTHSRRTTSGTVTTVQRHRSTRKRRGKRKTLQQRLAPAPARNWGGYHDPDSLMPATTVAKGLDRLIDRATRNLGTAKESFGAERRQGTYRQQRMAGSAIQSAMASMGENGRVLRLLAHIEAGHRPTRFEWAWVSNSKFREDIGGDVARFERHDQTPTVGILMREPTLETYLLEQLPPEDQAAARTVFAAIHARWDSGTSNRNPDRDWGYIPINRELLKSLSQEIKAAEAEFTIPDKWGGASRSVINATVLWGHSTLAAAGKRAAQMGFIRQTDWPMVLDRYKRLRALTAEAPAPPQPKGVDRSGAAMDLEHRLEAAEAAERKRFIPFNLQRIPGYFETPYPVIETMIDLARISPGMRVAEPSAGRGAIADRLPAGVQIDVAEFSVSLRELLREKGYDPLIDMADLPSGVYDRVVMNPPFEGGADVDHVTDAFHRLLGERGRVVAVMSPAWRFREGAKWAAFRELVDSHAVYADALPDNTFKRSGTGVATTLVVLVKD